MAIAGNGVTPMDPYSETLASLPQIPRNRLAGDGTQPRGDQSQPNASAANATPSDQRSLDDGVLSPPPAKTLDTASPAESFLCVDQLAKSQDRLRRNRYAIDLYHSWLDANIQFGRLDKVPNQNQWIAKLAPGVKFERGAAVPNKSADLCNKVADALLADPPKPNPQVHTNGTAPMAAGDVASTVLRQMAGESGINEVQQYRWALRNALTRSTSYLEYDIDREGGGYQPYQIQAHPQATDPAQPMVAKDPQTGEPLPTASPILRYVSAASPTALAQFVKNAADAERVWLPKAIVRKHQRTKIICFPATAPIEDADAALITDWCTLAEGRARWPDTVGKMTSEELNQLTQWRPSYSDLIVPFTFRSGADGMTGPALEAVGSLSPLLQKRMFFHRFYVKKSKEYPKGLKLDLSGANGGTELDRASMEYQVTLPTAGTETRCRDIPLVQVTPIQDVGDLDPTGWPFEARFDGSAQADATLIAGYLDALDRMAHPHVFIPSLVSIDEDEWFDRSKPTIIGPTDKPPMYEQFSPLPPIVQVSEYLQTRQDTSSGLTATAQGLDSTNSQSGIAKRLTVRQAQISLAGIQQQLHGAFTRGWRILCQLIQAEYAIPQLLQAVGEENSGAVTWWTGEDFAGVDDIGIEPGTGTMMTAEDKANYVRFLQESGWMTPEQGAEIGTTGVARDLGLPTDPTKAAIDRSVDLWFKGPPDEQWVASWTAWKQAQDAYAQAQQQYTQQQQAFQQYMMNKAIAAAGAPSGIVGPEGQIEKAGDDYQQAVMAMQLAEMQNPQIAVPPQAPQPPQVPKPWTPFLTRANDSEPLVAAQWMKRLSHVQMMPQYEAQPEAWRQCADARYTEARQAVALAGAAQQNHAPSAPAGRPHHPPTVGQPAQTNTMGAAA